jgi:glycosyltransferase involved in cell wall biosynthesis
MALGKPVIATAWSGNLDFMNKQNSALVSYSLIPVHDPEGAFKTGEQMWADANVEEAAAWLRRLAGDADLRARLGAVAAKDVAAQLSPKYFAKAVAGLIKASERR